MKKIMFILIFFPLNCLCQTEIKIENIEEKINNEKYTSAIEDLNFYIKNNPNDYWSHYLLGFSLKNTNNKINAIKNYLKCSEINPKFKDVNWELGYLYYELENYKESIKFYNKLIDLSEKDEIDAHFNIANAYYLIKDNDNSIKFFNNVILINNNDELVSKSYVSRGRLKNSIKEQSGCEDVIKGVDLYIKSLMNNKKWNNNASDIDYLYNSYCIDKKLYNYYFKILKKYY